METEVTNKEMKAENLVDNFVKQWREKNNTEDAVYAAYHYDAMIAFAEYYNEILNQNKMKAKLSKVDNGWALTVDNIIYATTENSPYKRLSLKNCQAIELGYDSDELADEWLRSKGLRSTTHCDDSFKAGFQKALELIGDKKFSERDVRRALSAGLSIGYGRQFEIENKQVEIDSYMNSLQQTEWDVEIVEFKADDLKSIHNEWYKLGEPKLDADGCLILKLKSE